ncbi:MAG: VOC family protein [Woeseiaceae bacterium]|jgi:hypothetical protein|nr:VOC family protein [Woeseiaceae bacterium]MDG1016641.1 VOC family protein [Woeseiaceae bacterium]MDG1713513.1 VOC family protein [Woeseiaceae bacterium]MDG1865284.1 VOC family protein [Woeseiaceae bacterium]|tara:strand:- start:222 stop:683 length:462 start_codon:yes stop_codon:yes gene_type:complete
MNEIKKEYVRFQRANYIVTDLDKSLKLYCNVLGMINQYEADAPDNSYSYDVFEIKKTNKIRWAVLGTPDQLRVMALTEIKDGKLKPIPNPKRCAIVIEVGNVDRIISEAAALGCHIHREEELVTHDGRIGREVGINDFDGNLIVIYHIPKKTN